MTNMHIENFKKSETFYKKITNHLFGDISKPFFLSRPNVKKTKLPWSIQVHLHMVRSFVANHGSVLGVTRAGHFAFTLPDDRTNGF